MKKDMNIGFLAQPLPFAVSLTLCRLSVNHGLIAMADGGECLPINSLLWPHNCIPSVVWLAAGSDMAKSFMNTLYFHGENGGC